jgi:hypothetical protein
VIDNGHSSKHFRNRNGNLGISGGCGGYRNIPIHFSEGCQEVIGSGAGIGGQGRGNGKGSKRAFQPTAGRGKRAQMIMGVIFKTTKEWWLVGLCLLLLLSQFFPQATEFVYPIIDWKGGNRLNMQVDKEMSLGQAYHCGEEVRARFMLQKQRAKIGEIQWKLISSAPGGRVQSYPARRVSSPVGISDHWAPVESLPKTCDPGQYHFEGTITYPLLLDKVVYTIRTVCFIVR